MKKVAALIPVALLAFALTACGGGEPKSNNRKAAGSPTVAKPTPAATLTWGQPAEVYGYNFTKIRVTPQALLYTPGTEEGGKASNGLFVAISVKAEALSKPDTTAGGAGGGGFQWRGSGQTITEMDGESSSTAWVGATPAFGIDSPIEPGDPREGIITFDIPAKGGRLVYMSPADNTISAAWTLPDADQGSTPGMVKVRKRIKLFS